MSRDSDGPLSSFTVARRMRANIVISYGAGALQMLSSFALLPYLLNSLGLTSYGQWIFLLSIALLLQQIDFGIPVALTSSAAKLTDLGAIPRLVRAPLRALICAGLVVSVAGGAVLGTVGGVSGSSPPVGLAIAAGVLVLFGLPLRIVPAVLIGLSRPHVERTLSIAAVALRVGGTVLVVEGGAGIVGVAAVETAAILLPSLLGALVLLAMSRGNEGRSAGPTVAAPTLRQIWFVGRPAFLGSIAAAAVLYTDNLVIGVSLGPAALALYAPGLRVFIAARTVVAYPLDALMSRAARLHADGDTAALTELWINASRAFGALTLSVVCPVVVLAGPILNVWVQLAHADATRSMQILLSVLAVNALHLASHAMLLGVGRTSVFAPLYIAWGVCNLALSALLVTRFGLVGVALATLLPLLILEPVYLGMARAVFGASPKAFFGELLLPVAAAAMSSAAVTVAVRPFVVGQPLVVVGGGLAAGAIAGLCGVGVTSRAARAAVTELARR